MRDAPPPSWRDTGSGSAEPSRRRGWQGGGTPQPDDAGPVSGRGFKRALAAFFLLTIVVALGVLILLPRQNKPSCLVLIGSGYEQNLLLPHNVYGWNGMKRLIEISEPEDFIRDRWARLLNQPTKLRRIGDAFELNEKTGWREAWSDIEKQIRRGDKKEKTVVLYFSMHGYADDRDAYLLRNMPAIQSLDDFEKSRISFKDVLTSLKMLKDKQIVVLLDVCHFEAHWPIGVVHNDFVERLQKKYAADIDEMGNLTLICSTAPDQRSWPSEELQTNWFAHRVAQVLAGAARREGEWKHTGRTDTGTVTAWSLYQHLLESVNKQAKITRAREQTPILLGDSPEKRAKGTALVHLDNDVEPTASSEKPLDTAELQRAWLDWRKLKTKDAPHVHAPHLWRLYQLMLLRHEQLTRAGDPTGAAKELTKKLAALQQELVDAKALKTAFQCAGNNFPIRRVLGFEPKHDAEVSDEMLRGYWTEDAAKAKAVLGKYSPPLETRCLLARMGQQVFAEQLAPTGHFDPQAMRARFAAIAKELQITERPVELQLLSMLRDADPGMDKDTLKLALQVRMAAEETALCVPRVKDEGELYAEAIFRRIAFRVEEADKRRRAGEDLLFGNPSEHAAAAKTKLAEAAKLYDAIRADADRTRAAMALRDAIAADLPAIAAWLAGLETSVDPAKIKQLRQDAETLGGQLLILNDSLADGATMLAATELEKAASLFDEFGADYRTLGVELEARGGKLQKQWHAIDAMLAVPPLGADDKLIDRITLRIDLLKKLREVSSYLHAQKGVGQNEGDTLTDRRTRQEKLLAACLKPYIERLDRIKDLDVGSRARQFFLKLPSELRAADGSDDKETLAAAAEVCRVIPGALAEPLRNDKTEKRINPVDRLRRLRTFDLLHGLAGRTLDDHWYDSPEAPYYKPAASAYLDSARSLFGQEVPKALHQRDAAIRTRLEPAGLSIGTPPNPYWTTETTFPLEWKIDADAGVPPQGTPMAWLDVRRPGQGATPFLAKPRVGLERGRLAASFVLAQMPVVKDGDIATVHVVFRGQHRTQELPVHRPLPDVIVEHPAAPDAVKFAVRMDSGFDYGAISVVLDNSGSMQWVYPVTKPEDKERIAKRPKEECRFDYALKGLQHVLNKTPNKTSLSIFCFDRNDNEKIQTVRSPAPWYDTEWPALHAGMKNLPANLSSPIANGIVTAMEKGFPPQFKGPKVVVVLTDGDDNLSFGSTYKKGADDPYSDHINTVRAGLRKAQLENPDVQVVVVCFIEPEKGPGSTEYERAKREFEGIEAPDLPMPGKLFMQPKGEKLGETIEDYLRPRVKLTANGKPAAVEFQEGRRVNYRSDHSLNWEPPLPPNNYRAEILRTHKNEFEVKMPRGHDILALLKRPAAKGQLVLERAILGRQQEVLDLIGRDSDDKQKETDGWLATLLGNKISLPKRELTQHVCFERAYVEAEPTIKQTHPGFVWMELRPDKGFTVPTPVIWGKHFPAPAACYRLATPPNLPEPQPKTAVWYWPREREAFLSSEPMNLKFLGPNVSDSWAAALSRRLEPPLESVVFEQVDLDIGGKKEATDCIVVRFQFPKGKPIFVDIQRERDGPDIGAVHRFFLDAGKGTAYFYGPVRPKTVNLVWFDIETFKKHATPVVFSPTRKFDPPEILFSARPH